MGIERGICALCGKERCVWRIFSPFSAKDTVLICTSCLGNLENSSIDKVIRDYICDFRGVRTPCVKCRGMGTLTYSDATTWRKSMKIGAQVIRTGVCDHCWGSGDEHNHWVDLRKALTGE